MSNMPSIKIEDLVNFKTHWPHRHGLIVAIVAVVGFEAAVFVEHVKLWIFLGIAAITVFLLAALWGYSRKLPKTKRDKVGFVVSMSCDNETEAKKIRADFVLTLQRLIKGGRSGGTFQFIEIPRFHADKCVDIEDAHALKAKTKAHFVLYGRVRTRPLAQGEHYFVELDGLVAHKPIAAGVSQTLAQEFAELFPKQLIFRKENDVFAFQFASDWTEAVAKYVIGVAAAISGDLEYAEKLYRDTLDRTAAHGDAIPVFAKLRERIPIRIAELYEARAEFAYEAWAATHEEKHLVSLVDALESVHLETSTKTSVLFLKAISGFLNKRDCLLARRFLEMCSKQDRTAVWHFNIAFLLAYEGNLQKAFRHYRKAIALPITPDLIAKVEDFLLYVATCDSDQYQIFYCLGFFNREVKGDRSQAIKDFTKFVSADSAGRFTVEKELALKWIKELGAITDADGDTDDIEHIHACP